LIIAVTLAAACCVSLAAAQIVDFGKYPDLKGQWRRFVVPGIPGQQGHDQTKPWGHGQQAPLTPEYEAIFNESLADQKRGGLGLISTARCLPAGMPHMMMAFGPQEYVVTPDTTYILIDWDDHSRRIFTDGRDWPTNLEPTWSGYSIGTWIDEDGDGRYDALEVETRGPFKGPRSYDPSGLPLHFDNQSVFKERIFLDKADKKHPAQRHDRDGPCVDASLDRRQALYSQSKSAPAVVRILLRRGQCADRHWQGKLFPCRWLSDAGEEGPEAARLAIFRSDAEVDRSSYERQRNPSPHQ
jgi:hypothetical protein